MRARNSGSSDRGASRRGGNAERSRRAGSGGGPGRGRETTRRPQTQRRQPSKPIDPEQFLVRQPWSLLGPLLAEGAPADSLERLKAYSRLLVEWNRGISNLISRNDELRFVERHLFESLVPAARMRAAGLSHVVDLGSGGGLPAIPLILAGVGERWTLVESRRNKTLFLRRVCQDFGLENVEVLTGRLESVIEENSEALRCDGFTSRATLTLGPTLELAGHIVRPGGHAFLWKGSRWSDELESAGLGAAAAWNMIDAIPLGVGPNVVVDMIKT